MIWFLAFSPKKKGHWWGRRFGHVSLIGFENETWVNLDLQKSKVDVRAFYTFEDTNDYLSYLLAHFTVLKFGPALPKSHSFFAPMTCVSFAKHVLGVRSSALLPDGLFRILIRKYNAEIMYAAEDAGRDGSPEASQNTG